MIANAKLENVKCLVKFTPIYDDNGDNDNMTYNVSYSVDTTQEYAAKYNQIVYNRDGKTRYMTTSEERTIPKVALSSIAGLTLKYEPTEAKALSNISEELISKHIADIFTADDYKKMFKYINNLLNDEKETIDSSIQDNPDFGDGIWPLDVIPSNIGNSVSVNRGQTYIRGQLYNVSSDDKKLLPTSGS